MSEAWTLKMSSNDGLNFLKVVMSTLFLCMLDERIG